MSSLILNGKLLASQIEKDLSQRVETLKARNGGRIPTLATILVGADPSSVVYVGMKGKACRRVGMESRSLVLPEITTTAELKEVIKALNRDSTIDGILLQHPVPPQINERACFDAIDPRKDVDGVTACGFGRMAMGSFAYGSATPKGIMTLLEHYNIQLVGKNAVVVGRSQILGKPMAMMLLNADATVTICHSKTKNLSEIIGSADILIAALGKPHFIKGQWLKTGAVVVDAGYHKGDKGIIGDVDLSFAQERCSAFTPVPGGVGPMTIVTLISQTLQAAETAKR